MAKRLADAVEASVKEHLKNGGEVTGYALTNGKTTCTISDPQEAFRRLNEAYGIAPEQFTACCKVNMTSLYSLMYTTLNEKEKTTQKAVKAETQAVLSGCMETKTSEGSIKKVY